MPLNHSRLRAPAVLLGSLLLALSIVSSAEAKKSSPVDIRVVDGKGKILAEQTQYTGSGLKVKTDPGASCFGDGTGGSGATVDIPSPTALSLLADAGITNKAVKPLSITDAFDFGLGLCGIGKSISPQTGFWSLKLNHAASMSGGDSTAVKSGDSVLWYLVNDFNDPPPSELVLKVKKLKAGKLPVQVFAYDDNGKKTPAAGAAISGFDGVTDAKGKFTLSPEGESVVDLTATLDGAIPSNEISVCTVEAKKCPAGYAGLVAGTKGDDKITVDSPVTVNCGPGKDTVTVNKGAKVKLKGCEKARGVL